MSAAVAVPGGTRGRTAVARAGVVAVTVAVALLAWLGVAPSAHAGPTSTGPTSTAPAPPTTVGVIDVPVGPARDRGDTAPSLERDPAQDAPPYLVWGLALSVLTAAVILLVAWRHQRRTAAQAR